MNGIQEVRGSIPLSSTIKSRRNLRLLSFLEQNSLIGLFHFLTIVARELVLTETRLGFNFFRYGFDRKIFELIANSRHVV